MSADGAGFHISGAGSKKPIPIIINMQVIVRGLTKVYTTSQL